MVSVEQKLKQIENRCWRWRRKNITSDIVQTKIWIGLQTWRWVWLWFDFMYIPIMYSNTALFENPKKNGMLLTELRESTGFYTRPRTSPQHILTKPWIAGNNWKIAIFLQGTTMQVSYYIKQWATAREKYLTFLV